MKRYDTQVPVPAIAQLGWSAGAPTALHVRTAPAVTPMATTPSVKSRHPLVTTALSLLVGAGSALTAVSSYAAITA